MGTVRGFKSRGYFRSKIKNELSLPNYSITMSKLNIEIIVESRFIVVIRNSRDVRRYSVVRRNRTRKGRKK